MFVFGMLLMLCVIDRFIVLIVILECSLYIDNCCIRLGVSCVFILISSCLFFGIIRKFVRYFFCGVSSVVYVGNLFILFVIRFCRNLI